MTERDSILSFKKLNEHNFVGWKRDMLARLASKGLSKFIDPKHVVVAGATADVVSQFDTDQSKAGDGLVGPVERWDKLGKTFEPKSKARISRLLGEFHLAQMRKNESIILFLNRITQLARDLELAGKKIPDDDIAYRMTCTLPPQYHNAVSVMHRWPDTDFIPSKVEAMLIEEFENLKARDMQSNNNGNKTGSSGDNTLSTDKRRSNKNKSNTEIICYHCEIKGHYSKDCRKKEVTCSICKTLGHYSASFLNNVGFAPTGKRNLISGSRTMEAGCTWSGKQDEIFVCNKVNKPILKFTRSKGLFKLSATGYSSDSNEVKSTSINGNKVNVIENTSIGDLELWHRRMMHTNIDSMVNMSKGDIARGLPKLVKKEMNCITCIKAKQTKHYGKAKTKITSLGVLDLVHTDVWGLTKYESKGGVKYCVSFVDDYTRWVKVYVMKSKSQVIDCFKDYISYMKRLTGAKIKRLRSDNGTEYCNDKLKQICKTHNIKHEVTNIYSPHMNGLSQKLLEGQTPYERVFNRKPNIHYFRVIGSKCYRLLSKTQRDSKLGPVSKECILIGYSWNTKAYRIYDPEEDKVYNTQDVRFIESSYADATKNSISFGPDDNGNRGKSVNPSPNPKVTLPIPTSSIPKVVVKDEGQSGSMGNWDRVVKQRPTTGQHPNRYDATLSYQGQKFRSAKSVMKYCEDNKIDYSRESLKDFFKYNNPYMGPWDIRNVSNRGATDSPDADSPDESHVSSTSVSNLVDLAVYFEGLECSNVDLANPLTYSEAIASPDKFDWKTAMGDEIETLRERNVFKEVNKTPQMKILDHKWVFVQKKNTEGKVICHRARLVARGFLQNYGTVFTEVAEPFKVGFDLTELNLEGDVLDASQYPYRTMVGILLFISRYTRPDISIVIDARCQQLLKSQVRVEWECPVIRTNQLTCKERREFPGTLQVRPIRPRHPLSQATTRSHTSWSLGITLATTHRMTTATDQN
uniref:Uncharacterized protein n=1 Tax=Strigamia maritima TaxID=126957 RepID=T1IYA1_STRMM